MWLHLNAPFLFVANTLAQMKLLLIPCCSLTTGPNQEARPAAPAKAPVEARLTPMVLTEEARVCWSPKGAKVALTESQGAMTGTLAFALGEAPKDADGKQMQKARPRDFALRLTRSKDAAHFDRLWVDGSQNGRVDAGEKLATTPSENRGEFWSSLKVTLALPDVQGGDTRAYPINFWFVEDPLEPDAAPTLRWSREGWHAGEVKIGAETIHVLITESQMDGVFDKADSWWLAGDAKRLASDAGSRSLSRHAWLGESAFRMTGLDPDGRWIRIEPFDPGVTRAQEEAAEDLLAADKRAKRAKASLAFEHDFEAAAARAKLEGKRLLVDFETTWCGPCKQMDLLVYTAAKVVDAAKEGNVIAVKVDGDDHRDLKKRFKVNSFPTMILLDAKGEELDRRVGYTGVAAMAAFLKSKP